MTKLNLKTSNPIPALAAFPMWRLVTVAGLALAGCGSGDDEKPTQTGSTVAGTSNDPEPRAAGAEAEDDATSLNDSSAEEASSGASAAEDTSSEDTMPDGPVEPAVDPTPAMDRSGSADADAACESCVSDKCSAPLADCEATSGCDEILTCVLDTGCAGIACYCGTAPLVPDCLAGAGDGACKAVALAQEGGREPTIDNPSGGPASDTAFALAQCASDPNTCADVCL
jgi:hypothetical protein